tara:strand:- start:98 stop:376 length:279 start_codon:yes stop_codon:yes gene_type:complete
MSISNTDKQIILGLANKIFNHGLSVPAIFFLEMVKYLSFFGSQLLIFFGPIITVFIPSESFYRVAELLEDRKNIELLLNEIERLESINKINE